MKLFQYRAHLISLFKIVWLCVSSIILIFTIGLLHHQQGETDTLELGLELALAVFQLYCTWMVYSEIMHIK